jgi:glyoxylase-like metal-dependent hydrolase (beta-lactamase superfamily II)
MPFEDSPEPTNLLVGGEEIETGSLRFRIIHTPGHSPGGISIYIPGHVFTGDALFEGSIGKTDLPGGEYDLLISSIRDKLLILPGDTIVHPGHGPLLTCYNLLHGDNTLFAIAPQNITGRKEVRYEKAFGKYGNNRKEEQNEKASWNTGSGSGSGSRGRVHSGTSG